MREASTGPTPRGLVADVRAFPAIVPMLVAVALLVVLAQIGGGYAVETWTPIALALLALLAVTAWALPLRALPRPVLVAVVALAAYTAWSALSVSWAADKGEAWSGTDRTLLYLVVFVLFALWPQRGRTATVVLALWTLAMAVFGVLTVLRLGGADAARTILFGDRLASPVDYPNAAAALWLMPVWPAVALAAERRLPAPLRGVLAGAVVVFAGLGLLTQSRGGALAVAIVLVVWFAAWPGRVRRLAVLVPVAVAVGAAAPTLLHVGTRINAGQDPASQLAASRTAILVGAIVVALVVGAGALLERHMRLSTEREHRVHRMLGAIAIAGVAVAIVGGLVAVGHPAERVRHAWTSFKGGYATNAATGPRLVSGLGSNRYDFYRVGLDVFLDHPVAGIGADNFTQEYLRRGHSTEDPRYPHSVVTRTLAQTGIVGALLLAVALGAAALAAVRAAYRGGPEAALVACGAAGVALYWLVHGAGDWLWEIAGLGAPAFALLGLACSLAPRRAAVDETVERGRPRLPRGAVIAGAVAAVLAALVLVAPWLSEREVTRATQAWHGSPSSAYSALRTASALNPLAARPKLVEGSIAVELGDLRHADRAFASALDRDHDEAFATLERGAIASQEGRRVEATRLLARAVAVAPRDPIARAARDRVAKGGRVAPAAIIAQLAAQARGFTR